MKPYVLETNTEKFLSGGGLLGQLMRDTDWEKTSLGNVANWPKSLKTCVRIILTSGQPMSIWWGKELINIYNDAYRSILGEKHPWALGKPAKEVWHETWDEMGPKVATAMRTNEGTYDESLLLIVERNGYPEETYYTFSYSPVPGDDGETAGIICTHTDDTQRILGERQLRTLRSLGKILPGCKSNEEVFKKAIQVLRKNQQDFPFAVIYRVDDSGNYAYLSGATTNDLPPGIVPEIIDIKSASRYYISRSFHYNSTEIEEDLVAKYGNLPSGTWQTSPDKSLIIPIIQSGHKHPSSFLKIGLNPYRETDEKYIGFFHLVADQIAAGIINVNQELEKRVAERTIELNNKNLELQQQKEFVETILDASIDIIAVLDKDLNYVVLNKKARELYNYNGNVVGKNILKTFPQIRKSGMYDDLLKALTGESIHRANYNSFLNRKFENFYIPLKDSNGDVHEILLVGHDITQLINASEELKQTNEALLKINNELEQFAYVSSHDLQEPLRKIQTFSDLLIHNVNDQAFDAKRYLEKINASASRMATLINDLLTYSRLSKVNDQFIETDLNHVLENVMNDFEVVIAQKNAVITSSSLPIIKAVPVQMNQLFYNLIGNALKFVQTDPVIDISFDVVDGLSLKQYVQLNHEKSYIQLNFRDNGIGFDQKYADKIFTVFQRLNNREQYNGTGIGLAVCKKIAESHGGHISAKSEPGKGASFTIYLPTE